MTAAGENKSLTAAGDYTLGILTRLGNKETLMTSTGDEMEENLDLLENKEDFDGFCRELRMRNFDLLGKLKPWGLHWSNEKENLRSIGD